VSEPASILIIDNDPRTCETVGDGRQLRGHVVETVTLGRTGLERIISHPVDAAIVDIKLPSVQADPLKLKQVVYNYLSNALKFTPEEGRVTIRVAVEDDENYHVEVEDTGIGIRPQDAGRLFVEFQQLDATTAKKYQGTGLGLALTRRIVEAQGGRVGFRSTPGAGSVFFAVLPRRPRIVSGEGTHAELGRPRPNAPSVLVIEDDPKDCAWLVRTLAAAGYAVETAAGAIALARCREQAFDANTLDLLLPDTTGREVLTAIRAGGPNWETPVVVVSVVADKSVGFEVHDIIAKPVQTDELLSSLHRAKLLPGSSRPVLVVDDDPMALKLAARALGHLGYSALCRSDAEAALATARETPPAAVILDLLMPEVDGFEFLRRFRRTAPGRRTPVIVWTMKDLTPAERDRLREAAQAVVEKAQGAAALMEELRTHVPVASDRALERGGA
jgi:CheY-like chemotaxis protein